MDYYASPQQQGQKKTANAHELDLVRGVDTVSEV